MLRRNEMQPPLLMRHVRCVDGTREQFVDTLLMHFAMLVFRPSRLRFQEAFHLDNGLEAPRGVALQGIGNDGRERLIAHEELAVSGLALHAIANRRPRHPIPIHGASAHAVFGLLCILAALVLRDSCQKIFAKLAVRVFAELDGWRFQYAACKRDGGAQLNMRFDASG